MGVKEYNLRHEIKTGLQPPYFTSIYQNPCIQTRLQIRKFRRVVTQLVTQPAAWMRHRSGSLVNSKATQEKKKYNRAQTCTAQLSCPLQEDESKILSIDTNFYQCLCLLVKGSSLDQQRTPLSHREDKRKQVLKGVKSMIDPLLYEPKIKLEINSKYISHSWERELSHIPTMVLRESRNN